MIWPVANRAAEAYIFASLAGKLPSAALAAGRLGGWTQTCSEMNKLGRMAVERERRMVTNSCLTCGKAGHFARKCPAPSSDNYMVYNCGHCNATLRITDQGRHTTQNNRGTKRLLDDEPERQQQRPRVLAAPAVPAAPVARQHAAARQVAVPQRQAFLRVKVCGYEYTSLQWFLGKKPAPRQVAAVLSSCKSNAVQLRYGDTKTLEAAGFAKSPPRAKELLPGRQNFPTDWHDTDCQAVRGTANVQLRRPGVFSEARGALWRVSDLQRVLHQ